MTNSLIYTYATGQSLGTLDGARNILKFVLLLLLNDFTQLWHDTILDNTIYLETNNSAASNFKIDYLPCT